MRRGPIPAFLSALVLLALAVAPLAAGQETVPVLVERVDDDALAADEDAPAVAVFELFNLNPDSEFYVSIVVDAPRFWDAEVSRNEFLLQPRNATLVEVRFEPTRTPQEEALFAVTFSLVNVETGAVTPVTHEVAVASLAPPLVLDAFPNPLGPPFDNAYGTFLLNMAFWTAVALFAIFVGDAIVRALTARASSQVTREILHKLRKPIFLFVFFVGLARSFAILPRNFFTETIAKTFFAIGVAVFGLYVVYRILDSALLYYQRTWASRTSSTLDDVLVPLLRKFGIVVLYVAGIIIVLRNLGWDPTVVLAGAGIAGLVIAFAAQDTFSNLFSGIFILLDRPFKEGDDIQLETGEFVRVEHIGLRTTRLYHPRNHESITLPNNQLATKRVVNLTGPDQRYWVMVDVGASYGSDPEKVKRVLLDLLPRHPRVEVEDPAWQPLVLFSGFGESSLNFVLRFAVRDYRERFAVASDIRFAVFQAFEREGIEIPFPQRTVWIRQMPGADGRLTPPSGSGDAAP